MKRLVVLLFLLQCFTSCISEERTFEEKFYKAISIAQENKIKNFDLNSITPFKWNTFLFVSGNESVPIDIAFLRTLVREENDEIPIDHDRFYFFYRNKLIRKFDLKNDCYSQQFNIENCGDYFLKKKDCIFRMQSNTKVVMEGTVFLIPNCKDLPDFMK
jgi:hypothetical protein